MQDMDPGNLIEFDSKARSDFFALTSDGNLATFRFRGKSSYLWTAESGIEEWSTANPEAPNEFDEAAVTAMSSNGRYFVGTAWTNTIYHYGQYAFIFDTGAVVP
jgi:hypothetical protein